MCSMSSRELAGSDRSADPVQVVELFWVMACEHGIEAMASDARKAGAGLDPSGVWWALATMLECVAVQLRGGQAESSYRLHDAEQAARESALVHAMVLGQMALTLFRVDQWHRAAAATRAAVADVERNGLVDHPFMANVFAVAGSLDEIRERSCAEQYRTHATALAGRLGVYAPWLSGESLLIVAAARVGEGNWDGACETLDLAHPAVSQLADADGLHQLNRVLRVRLARGERTPPIVAAPTPTERMLLQQLSTGRTLAAIASERCVSRNTIKSQSASLYRKLDVVDRHGAVERAIELGII